MARGLGNETPIKLTKEQKQRLAPHLIQYMEENYDIEMGQLAADLMLECITEKIGPTYYNTGVRDAMALMLEKTDSLYEIMRDE